MTLEYYRIFLSLFKQTHPQICCCSATRTRKVTYNLTRISSTCYAILWNIRLGEFQSLKLSLFNHTCVWVNSRRGKTVCRYRRAKITRGENNPVCSYNVIETSVICRIGTISFTELSLNTCSLQCHNSHKVNILYMLQSHTRVIEF